MPRKASSNSTKKKEEAPKPQKEIKSDNHWTKLRSKEKDTSKRVLPDTILPGTRKRTNYNYNLNAMAKRNIDGDKVVKQRPSVSVNTLEQREKLKKLEERKRKKQEEQEQRRRRKKNTKKQEKEEEPDEESEQEEEEEAEKQEAPKKKITSASSKKRARSPPPKKKKQQEEEDEDEDDKEESTEKDVNGQGEAEESEEEDEEPKPKKQATSKQTSKEEKESKAKEEKAFSNSNNKKQQQQKKKSETSSDVEDFGEPLSKKVIDLAVKLNAKPSSTNVPRKYADKYNEPMAIRTFNNLKWPKVLYKSEKHDFGTMEIMEIDLAERNEYKFLQDPKTIIIGSGDVLLVAKLDDLSSDFNVWIVDDEAKDKVEGPFKISEILAELTVDDSVEDEEDEE